MKLSDDIFMCLCNIEQERKEIVETWDISRNLLKLKRTLCMSKKSPCNRCKNCKEINNMMGFRIRKLEKNIIELEKKLKI